MTRINLIPVQELPDKMLLAEHREIKRIPNVIKSGKYKLDNIPDNYCLGTGHVKFFYDKLAFLAHRYIDLLEECENRGFNVTDYSESFYNLPDELFNIWTPSQTDIDLSRSRIQEKLNLKPNYYRWSN